MKENDVEKALYKMRDTIPVNTQLQEDLRNELNNKSKNTGISDSLNISENLNITNNSSNSSSLNSLSNLNSSNFSRSSAFSSEEVKLKRSGSKQNNTHHEKVIDKNKNLFKPTKKSSPIPWVKHLPKVAAVLILCLALYILTGITENGNIPNHVSAASLNVSNYMSLIDVNIGSGSPISVSEYNGSLYIAVFGSDLYEYSDSSLKEISAWKPSKSIGADVENDVEVNLGTGMEGDAETNLDADSNYGKALHSEIKWVRVSPNGRKLVYLSTQGIGIYNIETQESNLVLKQSDDGLTYYIEPTWHPDGNGIIYTKQVIKPGDIHGFEITESGIYYLNLETMEAEKLADGNHGAYIKGKNAIIYERDGMIILKSLEGINAIDNKSGNSSYNNLVNNSNSNDDNNSNNNNNSNNSSNSSNDGNSSTGVALGKNEQVIDQGRFPSVSPCGNYVAYIKTQKNIKKFREDGAANKDNAESKDNTSNKMNTKEGINAEIHETIDNIWIADVSNFENKKQITANFPYYFINETEWLESLEPSELKQVLSINGLYSYYSPVWSSDSRNIYAIRSKNEENSHESRIIKIKLSVNKEEKETIVEKYLQALVLRDEDYAKSLMKNPSELLTLSNPRYVGFKILRSSSESDKSNNERESDMEQKNDKEHEFNKNIEYADAEVYLSYTANPYYMIEISRYYLSSQEDGYIIDRIEPIQNIQVYEKNGVVYLEKELKNQSVTQTEKPVKQEIFRRDDIPAEFIPDGSFRFSCLAYYNTNAEDKEDDTAASKDKNVSLDDTAVGTNEILIFTLQTFDDGQQNIDGKSIKPSVSLLSYSLKDKTFKLIDKISDPSGGIICSNLILSTTGQYAAIDLVQEGLEMRNYTLIYELSSAEKVDITDLLEMQHISENIDSQDDTSTKASASQSINLNSVFWNKNGLVFSARIKQQSMNYIYKPELKKAEAF